MSKSIAVALWIVYCILQVVSADQAVNELGAKPRLMRSETLQQTGIWKEGEDRTRVEQARPEGKGRAKKVKSSRGKVQKWKARAEAEKVKPSREQIQEWKARAKAETNRRKREGRMKANKDKLAKARQEVAHLRRKRRGKGEKKAAKIKEEQAKAAVKVGRLKIKYDKSKQNAQEANDASAKKKAEAKSDDKVKSINIDFGGAKHDAQQREIGNRVGAHKEFQQHLHLARPELVKSQVCTDQKCDACTDKQSCWHGVGYNGHFLRISLDERHSFKTYSALVWARCSSSEGKWLLRAMKIVNGFISVFVDDVLVRKIEEKEVKIKKKQVLLPVLKETDSHIRVVFTPGKNKASSATVALSASGVAPYVDKCMEGKECLQKLGNGLSAFAVRNSNKVQLACLRGQHDSMSSRVKHKCLKWERCLPDEIKQKMKTFLGAAVGRDKAAIKGTGRPVRPTAQGKGDERQAKGRESRGKGDGSLAEKTEEDPNVCIDPSSDDPEAWSCECLQYMEEQCSEQDEKEECYREEFCREKKICQSWKDENCDSKDQDEDEDSLVASAAKRQRALTSTIDALDTSLNGKCAA